MMKGTRQEEEEFEMLLGEIPSALPAQQGFPDHRQQSITNAFANLSFKEDGYNPNCSSQAHVPFDVMGSCVSEQFNAVCAPNSLISPATASSSSSTVHPSHYRNFNGGFQPTLDDVIKYQGQVPTINQLLKQNGANPCGNMNSTLTFDDFNAPFLSRYRASPAHITGLQQCCPDFQAVPPLQQELSNMQLHWQLLEVEESMTVEQQSMLLQQAKAQSRALAIGLPNNVLDCVSQASFNSDPGDSYKGDTRQQGLFSSVTTCPQLQQPYYQRQHEASAMAEENWRNHLVSRRNEGNFSTNLVSSVNEGTWSTHLDELGLSMQSGNACGYYGQDYCSRGGERWSLTHNQMQLVSSGKISQPGLVSIEDPWIVPNLNYEETLVFPEKILTRNHSQGVNSVMTIKPVPSTGQKKANLSNGHGRAISNGHHLSSGSFQLDIQSRYRGISSDSLESEIFPRPLTGSQHQQPKYTCLEEVEGRIYSLAKDQHGCRFLQRKFNEGSLVDVQKIFLEIIDHIIELMTDPFGNYLVQKLLDLCNEDQRMQILQAVTGKEGELVNISLNMHGTRAVQKLIETLKTPEEVSMVVSSLKPGVVTLIKDLNGNHVVQRCLQRLSNEDSQFLFDAAAAHCVEIATHRHGCCVLQRCIDHSTGAHRHHLLAEIAANALVLSQDPFGNYVVQYVLDLDFPWATLEILVQLEGNYAYLSMQKFSSNVVEKCLKLSAEENRKHIILELINSSRLGQLLQDPYANYVVQSALAVSKGALHDTFVEAIRPHFPALRSSPFGKRILSRTNLKK